LLLFLISTLLFTSSLSKTAQEWESRSIYQLMTDRFAKDTNTDTSPCADLTKYCGGTYKGLINNLDYI
jgi:alpha-amylase